MTLLSGIAIDDVNEQAWVSENTVVVWLLDGLVGPCAGDATGDGVVNLTDFAELAKHLGTADPDADLIILFENWLCGLD